MKFRGELGGIVLVVVLGLVGLGTFGSLSSGCTDGATPDCTGDAAASCGVLPNEGGTDDGSTDDGSTGDSGSDATQSPDTGAALTDDGGDAGDAGDAGGD
jgi:hypothetical protein